MTLPAIILAAGRGSRMGALTEARPKCLTPLLGHPLLAWQLAALGAAGVKDITLIRGYRPETLAFSLPGLHYLDHPRWAETNMVGTLSQAEALLAAGPVLVAYSDIVYHPDHVRALMACEAPLAMTYDTRWQELWQLRFADPLADAESFRLDGDRVVALGARVADLSEIQGQYMGLTRWSPAAWQAARAVFAEHGAAGGADRMDMTTLLSRLIARGFPVTGVAVHGRWCEVDSAADRDRYEAACAAGGSGAAAPSSWPHSSWTHDWRWPEADPGATGVRCP